MVKSQMESVIRHLRRAVLPRDGAGGSDGELLESFIETKHEAAFAALFRRHAPMVLGVCRRIIGNAHDAEDALQATFLVLARRASAVEPREMVAGWLHGVAYRTALKARAARARLLAREGRFTGTAEPEAPRNGPDHDLLPLLDRELNALPEAYRLPILLCDLEGKSIKAAAGRLGWPQGTLAGRLARGRKMLAKRLARRGVSLAGGTIAALLSQGAGSACVPPSLAISTVGAATLVAAGKATVAGAVPAEVAALVGGVLRGMSMTKIKIVAVLLASVGVALGGGLYTHLAGAQECQTPLPSAGSKERRAEPSPKVAPPPSPAIVRVAAPPEGYGALFDRTLGVLSDYFTVEYANRFDGRIETGPRRASGDPSLRRRAVARITALDGGGYSVEVKVFKEEKAGRPKTSPPAATGEWEGVGLDGEFQRVILDRVAASKPGENEDRAGKRDPARDEVRRPPAALGITAFRERVVGLERRLAVLEAERVATIGDIIVVGNTRTATSVIRKMIPLRPGDSLDRRALRRAEENLSRIGATIRVIEGDRPEFKDILVKVREE